MRPPVFFAVGCARGASPGSGALPGFPVDGRPRRQEPLRICGLRRLLRVFGSRYRPPFRGKFTPQTYERSLGLI